jgi:glycosyltransferase involved in cell wall biosynthesis
MVSNSQKIKNADLVVGIPSFNEADNIGFVAEVLDKGLLKYYRGYKAVIINVDNNSLDGTKDIFLGTKTKTPKIYISTSKGVAGKGNNFFNLFEQVKKLKPRAVMVVDADLKSITPEWVKKMLDPILEKGYEYVTPWYARNEYDGTITNNIAYPLIYGIYGINLRQPIGGDFAFHPKLVNYWLESKWHKATKNYGVDIFMTLEAIINKSKICQVCLGQKIHKPSAPKLGPMFSQVVGTMFKKICSSKDQWLSIESVKKITILENGEKGKPQPLSVDYKSMKIAAIFEYKMHRDILKRTLTPEVYQKLDKIFKSGKLTIGKTLWTKIIYDAVYSYCNTNVGAGIVEALKPLYFGKTVSFIKNTLDLDYKESEMEVLEQAERFWDLRGYLLKKYK